MAWGLVRCSNPWPRDVEESDGLVRGYPHVDDEPLTVEQLQTPGERQVTFAQTQHWQKPNSFLSTLGKNCPHFSQRGEEAEKANNHSLSTKCTPEDTCGKTTLKRVAIQPKRSLNCSPTFTWRVGVVVWRRSPPPMLKAHSGGEGSG